MDFFSFSRSFNSRNCPHFENIWILIPDFIALFNWWNFDFGILNNFLIIAFFVGHFSISLPNCFIWSFVYHPCFTNFYIAKLYASLNILKYQDVWIISLSGVSKIIRSTSKIQTKFNSLILVVSKIISYSALPWCLEFGKDLKSSLMNARFGFNLFHIMIYPLHFVDIWI